MKAVLYTEYGGPEVLQFKEVDKPMLKENEILVQVHASTVSAGVLWARSGKHPDSTFFTFMLRLGFGLKKPRKQILGYEFSGEIVEVGEKVKLYKKGDEVFGTTTGLKQGSYAEYVCIPEKWSQGVVNLKPSNLTHGQSASLPIGGMTALHILRKASIQKGQKVLIYGASGSVGTYAVQLAKNFGAEVTGVCSNSNFELVKSIGADKVIDYRTTDFTQNGIKYNVVFDAVGKISQKKCKNSIQKKGHYLSVKSVTSEKIEYLTFLKELIEKNKIKPVIDRQYPLDSIAEAHSYVDKGHKRGNVVIDITTTDLVQEY